MSLEPLRIGAGRKLAAVMAGLLGIALAISGWLAAGGFLLRVFEDDTDDGLITAGVIVFAVSMLIGQLLVRLALGRHRTGGGIRRFTGFQLGAAGLGIMFGLLGLPLLTLSDPAPLLSQPAEWVICCVAALVFGAVSVVAFLPARRRPGQAPPSPGQMIVPGAVVTHWMSPPRAMTFDISVIQYTGPDGQERYVRHLYRQALTGEGIVGEAHVEVARPERVAAFWVLPMTSKPTMRDMLSMLRRAREIDS